MPTVIGRARARYSWVLVLGVGRGLYAPFWESRVLDGGLAEYVARQGRACL